MISEYFEYLEMGVFPIVVLIITIVGIIATMIYNFIKKKEENIIFFIVLVTIIFLILAVYIAITYSAFIDYTLYL